MSHFNFESMVSDATRLDAPIQRGPLMRWQRKALESGVRNLSTSEPCNLNLSGLPAPKSANYLKTPSITPKTPLSGNKTPGSSKTPNNRTPGKTPGKYSNTPGDRKTPSGKLPRSMSVDGLTPGKGSDRFIPNRSTLDLETSHHLLLNSENVNPISGIMSPNSADARRKMSEALNNGQVPDDAKILSFKQKAPAAKEGYINSLKVLYSQSTSKSTVNKSATQRVIAQQPDRIMDAPDLIDDYYLNLLDWSANNHVALSLNDSVYLWNAGNGAISQLMTLEAQDEYISSVSWITEGNILAVGTSSGCVQLWDVGEQKLMRNMTGHSARVGSLSWNAYILSSGCRTGAIHHHDVRIAEHHVGTIHHHQQEVCGLAWSPDGQYLASGGNDNMAYIYGTELGFNVEPIHTFSAHQAAVKAISWCPWQPSLLATGGGTADRQICFWNVTTGTMVQNIDTKSQVCSIKWSKDYKELISGHGFSKNQLTIWKYPSMTKVAELTSHTARVLGLAMSPDGTTVASIGADETMQLWSCFQVDKKKKKEKSSQSTVGANSRSALSRGIR